MTIFFNSSLSLWKYIELLWPLIQLIHLLSTVDIRMKFVHSNLSCWSCWSAYMFFILSISTCNMEILVCAFRRAPRNCSFSWRDTVTLHVVIKYRDILPEESKWSSLPRHLAWPGSGLGHNNLTNLTISQHTCVNSPIWSCNLSTDSLEMWSSVSSWH